MFSNRTILFTCQVNSWIYELDKSVSLSICGLAPAQSQMDLFLDTLYERKQTKGRHFNQSGEAMSRVTTFVMFCSGT